MILLVALLTTKLGKWMIKLRFLMTASIVDDPDCNVATCDEENDQCVETARTPKSIACVLNLSTGEIVAAGIGTGDIHIFDDIHTFEYVLNTLT